MNSDYRTTDDSGWTRIIFASLPVIDILNFKTSQRVDQ